MTTPKSEIYNMDCLEGMRQMDDDSITFSMASFIIWVLCYIYILED